MHCTLCYFCQGVLLFCLMPFYLHLWFRLELGMRLGIRIRIWASVSIGLGLGLRIRQNGRTPFVSPATFYFV